MVWPRLGVRRVFPGISGAQQGRASLRRYQGAKAQSAAPHRRAAIGEFHCSSFQWKEKK